jgi:hypothetical protein
MTLTRFHFTRFLLSARSQGCDYHAALHYACERAATQLVRSFSYGTH